MSTDSFGDWATACVAAATFLLFVTAVWAGFTAKSEIAEGRENVERQLRTQRALEARRRVFDLQSTFHSHEFVEMSAKLATLARLFSSHPKQGEAAWNAMPDLDRMTVVAVLNFYELVASEYNANLLDRKVADMNLAYTVVGMWDYVRKLVTHLRRDNAAYFDEWEHLYERHGPTIRAAALRRAQDESDVSGAGPPLRLSEAERVIRSAYERSPNPHEPVT